MEISQDLQVRLLDRNQGQTNKEFETSHVILNSAQKMKIYHKCAEKKFSKMK